MIVYATKKCLQLLQQSVDTSSHLNLNQQSWHANVITMDEYSALLFMHDTLRLSVVLIGSDQDAFFNLDALFYETLEMSLALAGFNNTFIKHLIGPKHKLVFKRATNMSLISRLRKKYEIERVGEAYIDTSTVGQPYLSKVLNYQLFDMLKQKPMTAIECVINHFKLPKEDVFTGKAYEIDIILQKPLATLRRVIVPAHLTLSLFHDIIQNSFEWDDMHSHLFISENGNDHTLYPNETEDILDDDEPSYSAFRKTIDDFFSTGTKHVYLYDIQKMHIHVCQIKKVHNDFFNHFPVCIAASGAMPPKERVASRPNLYKNDINSGMILDRYLNDTNHNINDEARLLMQINMRYQRILRLYME